MRIEINKKSKFMFNEFKSIILNELLIINSLSAKMKVTDFITKLIKRDL